MPISKISQTVKPVTDFQDQVSLGNISGVTAWNKFGYRSNLQAATGEQLITAGGISTAPTILSSASTFTIAYDGTGGGSTDGASTDGARTITFYYLDSNGEDAVATHVLETDGSDVTSFTGLGINRAVVSSSGSGQTNASDITITATTGGSEQAFIPAGQSVTQQLWFHVATNRVGLIKNVFLAANKLSGSSPKVIFKIYVFSRTVSTIFEIFRFTMDTATTNELLLQDAVNFRLNSGDVAYVVGDTDTNNTLVEGRFSLDTYTVS